MSFRKWVFVPRAVALALVFVVFGAANALAQTFAYVTNIGDNTVSVIDTGTAGVIATVPVGLQPYWVAATPDGAFVWVGNLADDTISVIDTTSNTVVGTLSIGDVATFAFTPDGARAYVTRSPNEVVVIDTATFLPTAVITVGTAPVGVSITPDGSFAFVANQGDNTVSYISTNTNGVLGTIAVGNIPRGTAITPDGGSLYVGNLGDGTISEIATAGGFVTATFPSGTAFSIAFTPSGAFAYVTSPFSAGVSVIDTASRAIVADVPVFRPNGVAVTPDGASAYATSVADSVEIIDTTSNLMTGSVPVGVQPQFIAFATPAPPSPTSKDQCKNGGWQTFTNPSFKSQGECIKYVNGL